MLCLAFSEIQSRDFLAALPIPGLRSGSNAKAFFNPHLSGVIISATPIGAVLYYPRRASRQVLGFGLTIHGCPRKLIPAYPMCPGCLQQVQANAWTSIAGTETAKIPAGMTDIITPGEATIRIAKHEWWSETRGFAKPMPKPRGGHVDTIWKFNRGVVRKDSGWTR